MLKILIPTDFSDASMQANKYAINFASGIGGEIYFFHAYHFPVTDPMAPAYGSTGNLSHSTDLMEEHEKNMKNQMINLCSETRNVLPDSVQCEFILKPGFFVDQMLETINEENIDLVIMGTKGASGIKEAIFGSNTADVLEKASCPVLAVPEEANLHTLERIIFTSDYDERDIKKIAKLHQLFKPFNPQILIVHISEKDNKSKHKDDFQNKLNSVGPDLEIKEFKNDDVLEGINEAVHEVNADMVAMTNRKKGFFEGLFSKNITKQMVYHTKIPLFTFND